MTSQEMLTLAIQAYQTGQKSQAETLCYQILETEPQHADAWHGLAILATDKGDYEQALDCMQRALICHPEFPIFYNSLGNIYWYQRQFEQAIAAYQQALQRQSNYVDALNGLGNVYSEQENWQLAQSCYERAIQLNPGYAQAHNGLGNVLKEQRHWAMAIDCYQRAVQLSPNYAEAHNNLGGIWCEQGNLTVALDACQRALALKPNYAKAYNNLGNVLRKQYRFSEAIANYEQAVRLDPNLAIAYSNLGNVYRDKGMLNEAVACHQQALKLQPLAQIYSNLLFLLNYLDEPFPKDLYQEFDRQYASSQMILIADKRPRRRLRIAYISSDLRRHSVGYFIAPILAHHNHDDFEVICYDDCSQPDEVTQRFSQYADHWIRCRDWTDTQLLEHIRNFQVDILIDLMGHTGHNRLLVFAQKPAPVQITYLGYPNTTGLSTMDYRLTDHYADPMGQADELNTEQLLRMPRSYFCYEPYEHSPDPVDAPILQKGIVTLGSFNYYTKLSPTILNIWAQILLKLPQAQLVIKSNTRQLLHDPAIKQHFENYFERLGLDRNRLILKDFSSSIEEHLAEYQTIDIALDTYPYNGATTTCEALWMGVPVVTLVGKTSASRMGLSILATLGLPELIAYCAEDYVEIVVNLAQDGQGLQALRAGLRSRMDILGNGVEFTRQLETLYRQVWWKCCR